MPSNSSIPRWKYPVPYHVVSRLIHPDTRRIGIGTSLSSVGLKQNQINVEMKEIDSLAEIIRSRNWIDEVPRNSSNGEQRQNEEEKHSSPQTIKQQSVYSILPLSKTKKGEEFILDEKIDEWTIRNGREEARRSDEEERRSIGSIARAEIVKEKIYAWVSDWTELFFMEMNLKWNVEWDELPRLLLEHGDFPRSVLLTLRINGMMTEFFSNSIDSPHELDNAASFVIISEGPRSDQSVHRSMWR